MSRLFTPTSLCIIALVIILFGSSDIRGQRKSTSGKPAPTTKAETPSPKRTTGKLALDTSGLKSPTLFGYVHDGRFERLRAREIEFKVMFLSYVRAFSDNCQSLLPKDREEITYIEQTYTNQVTTVLNGRGIPIGSYSTSIPTGSRNVKTGVYVDPQFGAAYRGFARDLDLFIAKQFLQNLMSREGFNDEGLLQLLVDAPGDNTLLLKQNGCQSAATNRFSNNLLRFARSQSSIQEQNGEPSYFEKECRGKLPRIFPSAGAGSCSCLHRVFKAALTTPDMEKLEDAFDVEMLLFSFSQSGLSEKVSSCLR